MMRATLADLKGRAVRRFRGQIDQAVGRYQTMTCRVRGCDIILDVKSVVDRFRATTYTVKEPETLDWIERYLRPGDVLYDIGANIGLYALYAARRLRGQCRVYAFEPEALNAAQLNRNVFLNKLSGIVMPCSVAITDRLSLESFYLNDRSLKEFETGQRAADLVSGTALHNFGSPVDFQGKAFSPCHVQGVVGVPVDHLWQAWGVPFPTHMKIDVDGLEPNILEGAAQTLNDSRLKSILIEVPREGGAISERLARAGFSTAEDVTGDSNTFLKNHAYEGFMNQVFCRKT